MKSLLQAVGLKKTYRQGTRQVEVLRGVDFSVAEGEAVVIVGPSGSGKSTLLHLLGGLDWPTGGKVRFQGKDLYALGDGELARTRNLSFGFVFQSYHLVPELTALENVALAGWIRNGAGPSRSALKAAQEILEQVGLRHRLSHRPTELSGGEQQRVALARALVNRPPLLFCDEPTGNLDSETGSEILKLLAGLHREQGTTFVIVTHEPVLQRIASRVLLLKDGRL
ncbi:MAG: ABC transporter ATP-binding protein [Candidatus Omnitrophica bacterium]|nr:ABC transporter ATP-binding protein [Candidatus Omnitrophota bacterium]